MRVHGIESGKDHGLDVLEAAQRGRGRAGSASPAGGGRRRTTASKTSGTQRPVLALTGKASVASSPTVDSIISWVRKTSALGRSILLITGIMSRPLLIAR